MFRLSKQHKPSQDGFRELIKRSKQLKIVSKLEEQRRSVETLLAGLGRKLIKRSTEVAELQCVPQPKSIAPPPTAQTHGPNRLKFSVEAPLDVTFRIIEATFEFCP